MFVDEFNEYASKHIHHLPKYTKLQHEPNEVVTSIFHFWLQLIDSDTYRILKPNHQLIHQLTIAYHSYVANHEISKKLKKQHNSNEVLFIYSYFISRELQLYLVEKIPSELTDKYYEYRQDMSYYELTDSSVDENLYVNIAKVSRQLHYELINDALTKERLLQVLNNSYDYTLKYLENQLHT